MGINFPKKLKVPCGLKFRGVNEHQLCEQVVDTYLREEGPRRVSNYHTVHLKVTQYYASIIFQYIWEKEDQKKKKIAVRESATA